MHVRQTALSYFFCLALILLTACNQPVAEPTRQPALAFTPTSSPTKTPFYSAMPKATVTLQTIVTDTSTPEYSTVPCLELLEAKAPVSGPLHIVYGTDCVYVPDLRATRFWLWKEDTKEAIPLPLPDDAFFPRLSADHSLIAFRRDVAEFEREIWVIESDGHNERKLTTVSLAEVKQRFPEAVGIGLEYGWIQDTHTVAFQVYAEGEVGRGFYMAVLVDAETGEERAVVPSGQVSAVAFAPDWSQIATLTLLGELRLIDTSDREVQFTIPLSLDVVTDPSLAYSPNGEYLLVFTTGGIAIVDTASGSHREVPIEYVPFGCGDVPPPMPDIPWVNDTSFYLLGASEFIDCSEANYSVWRVDAAQGIATTVQSFTGLSLGVLSPDLKYLLYRKASPGNNQEDLYLSDLTASTQILYARSDLFAFIAWSPDSTRFFYAEGQPPNSTYHLGHIGQEPAPLGDLGWAPLIRWVDSERFVAIVYRWSGRDELRIFTLDGRNVLIAALQPDD